MKIKHLSHYPLDIRVLEEQYMSILKHPKVSLKKEENPYFSIELFFRGGYYFVQSHKDGRSFTSVPIHRIAYAEEVYSNKLFQLKVG